MDPSGPALPVDPSLAVWLVVAMSFAAAAHRLGASPVFLPVEQSSIKKGETLDELAAAYPDQGKDKDHGRD